MTVVTFQRLQSGWKKTLVTLNGGKSWGDDADSGVRMIDRGTLHRYTTGNSTVGTVCRTPDEEKVGFKGIILN